MTRPDGIIFDLDGTLLDTLEDIGLSLNRILERHGRPTHALERYRYFIGKGVASLLRRATGLKDDDPLLARIGREFREDYNRHWKDHTTLYSGIPELLDTLSGSEIRMAVLTNKYQEYADLNRTLFLAQWTFAPFLGAVEDRPLKPAPDGVFEILRAWDLPADRVFYVGDTDTDMQTAQAAGVFAIGAGWGFREQEELSTSGADLVVKTPAELEAYLRSLLS